MKKQYKRAVIIAMITVAIFGIKLGYDLIALVHAYRVEDDIADRFGPVAKAIENYYTKNGSVPPTLNSLMPAYLSVMPTSQYADSIKYTVLPNNDWVLDVHSTTLKPSRTYSFRSNSDYTNDERARLIFEYHLIAVFRDK